MPDDTRRAPSSPRARWRPLRLTTLLRHATFYWVAAALLAAVTAIGVHRVTRGAANLQAAHGNTVEVAVTTATVERGQPIAHLVEWKSVPLAFVPADVVDDIPVDARAAHSLGSNAIITNGDLTTRTLIEGQQAAIALPVTPTTPTLVVGQQVLVVVHRDPFAGIEGRQVPAVVYDLDVDRVTIVIARTEVEPVAAALHGAGVTLALV